MGSYLLLTCIVLPFIGAISLFFIQEVRHARDVALGFSLLTFLSSIFLWILFTNDLGPSQYQFITEIAWASSWNIHFSLGIDGISLFFIVLSAFLVPACILVSYDGIKTQQKEFMMLFLLLEGFLMCVFSVLDLVLFYIFFESVLIPMFILVGVWGSSENRIMAAYQLFIYTVIGSFWFSSYSSYLFSDRNNWFNGFKYLWI